MLLGIGTDITDLSRVRRILDGSAGERFIARVLTDTEIALLAQRREVEANSKVRSTEFVAGRFAAKEAVSKALGTGIGESIGFRDIDIIPDAKGKPECRLSDQAIARLGLRPGERIHVSISHNDQIAVAFAVWESVTASS